MNIRVYYEDTDSLGMVYHANYLKFIERARSEAFFAIGQKPENVGAYFVVRSMNVRFIRSAKLGDTLEVRSRLKELRAASFWLEQELWLDQTLIFSAEVEIVSVKETKPVKIDEATKRLLTSVFPYSIGGRS
ncbi:MAG: YbgC/FadM family acyl-CoA thioesterase [Helicobacteraceae bacterium]|jgi:acyl-CoA thioester hydrolase|nr:YbgC/FadM family acyl-CoA thioesterase [Helicobacteraceae bacterium]